jgi:hypothetical protein
VYEQKKVPVLRLLPQKSRVQLPESGAILLLYSLIPANRGIPQPSTLSGHGALRLVRLVKPQSVPEIALDSFFSERAVVSRDPYRMLTGLPPLAGQVRRRPHPRLIGIVGALPGALRVSLPLPSPRLVVGVVMR